LAVITFLAYAGIQQDEGISFGVLVNLLKEFTASPIKIVGESLNIVFGLGVYIVSTGGQVFDRLFSLLDKFISLVGGTEIRGTKDAKEQPANKFHTTLAFLAYGLLSLLTVAIAF